MRHRPVLIRYTESRYKVGVVIGIGIIVAGIVAQCATEEVIPVTSFTLAGIGAFVTLVSMLWGWIRTG